MDARTIPYPLFSVLFFLGVLAPWRSSFAQTTTGLDALSENRLLIELAVRGQTMLLERAIVVDHVNPSMAESLRAIAGLRDGNPNRTATQRQELARQAATGIVGALPTINDSRTLMDLAGVLLADGAARDVNTLEYWGENLATMGNLRPVAEAISQLLEKAVGNSVAQADAVANQIKTPEDPLVPRYQQLAATAENAKYTKAMADYVLALAIDPADPQRKVIANRAIEILKPFDSPETQVQPAVRNRVAKLHMLCGEYKSAIDGFDSVASGVGIKPAPSAGQQFEARYFAAVAELLGNHAEAAQRRLDDLAQWIKGSLNSKPAQDGANAACAMLQYRIDLSRNERDKAIAVLLELVKDRPELSTVIYEQLRSQLPDNPEVTKLDPLLLEALVRKADEERLVNQPDAATLNRGVAAARELLRRQGVDPELSRGAALTYPFLLEKLGRHAESAGALLDYVQKYPAHATAGMALDAAQNLVAQLRHDSPDDGQVVELYERFLAIAIAPPFSRTQFAFEYAARLQRLGKYADAAKYFELVPAGPKREQAEFFRVLALKQLLDQRDTSISREDMVKIAEEIGSHGKDVEVAARAKLVAADLDRPHAIAILDGFEKFVDGAEEKNALIAQAMTLRVNAYMAGGDDAAATRVLVALLEKTGGAEGADIVYNLLTRLNTDLDHAAAQNDRTRIKTIARNRAALSGFLVQWARKNPNDRIRQYTSRYALFDAESKRIAAEYEDAPAARTVALNEALKLYQSLDADDPLVTFGIALIQFDLAHYGESQPLLARLLAERKLGPAVVLETENGQERQVDNDRYWEATYKLFRCNLEMAKRDAQANSETIAALKRTYIQWGSRTGGAKWHNAFEAMRKEIAPDLKVPDLSH